MSEGMEPAAGTSGGGRNWRKADYPDKLMELQSLISQSAAGGNLTGMFYGAEMLVAILGIAWDFEDEEIETIENQRTQKVITEFRDHRREIEKDWDKPADELRTIPPPERIFKTVRLCWQLIDDVIQPLVRKTPISRSKFMAEEQTISVEESRDTSEEVEGIVP
tara:strand:- start:3862 stop:4353 length:492 start_codon:yes stop_codon:yes gene_type:complete